MAAGDASQSRHRLPARRFRCILAWGFRGVPRRIAARMRGFVRGQARGTVPRIPSVLRVVAGCGRTECTPATSVRSTHARAAAACDNRVRRYGSWREIRTEIAREACGSERLTSGNQRYVRVVGATRGVADAHRGRSRIRRYKWRRHGRVPTGRRDAPGPAMARCRARPTSSYSARSADSTGSRTRLR